MGDGVPGGLKGSGQEVTAELRRVLATLKRAAVAPGVVQLGSYVAAGISGLPLKYGMLLMLLVGPCFAGVYWTVAWRILRTRHLPRLREQLGGLSWEDRARVLVPFRQEVSALGRRLLEPLLRDLFEEKGERGGQAAENSSRGLPPLWVVAIRERYTGRVLHLVEVASVGPNDLGGADLRGVDLSGADLSPFELNRTDLREANLCGADLRGRGLGMSLTDGRIRSARFKGARYDDQTRWPGDFNPVVAGCVWVARDRGSGEVAPALAPVSSGGEPTPADFGAGPSSELTEGR